MNVMEEVYNIFPAPWGRAQLQYTHRHTFVYRFRERDHIQQRETMPRVLTTAIKKNINLILI